MYYKTQNSEEFYFLLNFATSKGYEIGSASGSYKPYYPLLCLKNNGTIVSVRDNGYDHVILSEFIKAIEEYKRPIKICGDRVIFNKGCIEVGDVAISNQLVRDIVKNLID